MSTTPTAAPLVALINDAAAGRLPIDGFVVRFKDTHERLERRGRVIYKSRDEARLIWDVLWAIEFYEEPSLSADPLTGYSHDLGMVESEVKRVAERLKVLRLFG